MRKIIIFIAGVAVLAAPVCVWGTGFGSVVSSFRSPGAYPNGLAYRPGYLYISTGTPNVLWRVTTVGSIISYHPNKLEESMGTTLGVIGGKLYYWIVDYDTAYTYRFIDNSSSVVASFAVPGEYPWGAAFVDAAHMYYTDATGKKLYLLHPVNGSVYASYTLEYYAGDLAYDASGYLWIGGPYNLDKTVRKCTLTGSPIASFSTAIYGNPGGIAHDGEYLWVGIYNPQAGFYGIFRYAIREEPAVTPGSVGRVKALFK